MKFASMMSCCSKLVKSLHNKSRISTNHKLVCYIILEYFWAYTNTRYIGFFFFFFDLEANSASRMCPNKSLEKYNAALKMTVTLVRLLLAVFMHLMTP